MPLNIVGECNIEMSVFNLLCIDHLVLSNRGTPDTHNILVDNDNDDNDDSIKNSFQAI